MIIDSFFYFQEKELLDLRFKLSNQYIDLIVIVEANLTHQGQPKDYNFPYEKYYQLYGDKIKYFKIELQGETPWEREHENRAAIFKYLQTLNLSPTDLVFFSDCDEIFSPNVLNDERIKNLKSPTGLMQMNFVFDKNLWANTITVGTIVAKWIQLQNINEWQGDCLNFLRDKRNFIPRIENAGWHFSYYGGFEKVVEKCSAIAEGNLDYNTEEGKQKILQYIIDAQNGRGFSFAPRGVTYISELESNIKELEYWTVDRNNWIQEKGFYKVRI